MADIDFYYPFDSVNGDRAITAAVERRFWGELFADGVVGYGGFAISTVSAGVYEIGPGLGIVGGAVGGIKTAKRISVSGPAGSTVYISLRANTNTSQRNVTLVASQTYYQQTADQLDAGGTRDLMLYSVTIGADGSYGVLDQRTYCTSFDAQHWAQILNNTISNIEDQSTEQLNALRSLFEAATDAANAETAGMFGAAGRQGFINPQFTVNQRGKASYGITSGSAYTYDRWKATVQGKALSSAMMLQTVQDGQRHALRVDTKAFASSTSNTGRAGLVQNIEGGVRTFAAGGKSFTVSFDAKANKACVIGVDAKQIAESGTAGTDLTRTVNVTTSWQRYSVTFTGSVTPTAAQLNDVLQVGFYFQFTGYTRYGSDQDGGHTVYLANMQVNEGNAALACYARSYADELEACQRYYIGTGYVSLAVGATLNASNQVITSPLPIARRLYRVPNVTSTDRVNAAGYASAEVAAGGWRHGLSWSLSGNSVDYPVFVVTNTDGSGVTRVCFNSLGIDAEISD